MYVRYIPCRPASHPGRDWAVNVDMKLLSKAQAESSSFGASQHGAELLTHVFSASYVLVSGFILIIQLIIFESL